LADIEALWQFDTAGFPITGEIGLASKGQLKQEFQSS
jgi:hypothetical protein